ncbi:MAG: FIST C-terminal domain-containing protein [Alphaproteobacteria bacterium]|nr:FIST C-terminal domain-containing protein [Alphaproteobacteria bacterium]
MKLETFTYTSDEGWSVKTFPQLDSEQTLVLIFAAPEMIQDLSPIKELSQHYPKSKIIGCSSAGEIAGSFIHDKSLSVAIVRFKNTPLKIIKSNITNMEESLNVGKQLAQELKRDDLKGILVLSDGLLVNGSELVKGLNLESNENVVITGGLAGDGDRFKETWIIFNGEILKNTIAAVGFYGDNIQIGFSSRGGWDVFGPERYITRAKKNILYELDGQPALKLYKDYLGERAAELPSSGLLFPLAIRQDQTDTKQLVRTILAINEEDQSLIFAGDVPTGYLAQLMRANFDRLIDSAGKAGEIVAKKLSNDKAAPILSIAISCIGRRLLLGERTEEEIEAVLESLPVDTQQIGFYSYGELSPTIQGTCDLHNQTMTLTTLSEK